MYAQYTLWRTSAVLRPPVVKWLLTLTCRSVTGQIGWLHRRGLYQMQTRSIARMPTATAAPGAGEVDTTLLNQPFWVGATGGASADAAGQHTRVSRPEGSVLVSA